jgi:CRP/FNR family cyclic AMP-dependent transcriptional regulator
MRVRDATGDAMNRWDAAGYLASVLLVMAFCMKNIVSLRLIAIASNVAFLTYAIGLGLFPMGLVHAILLPVNCWRLWHVVK